LPEKAVIHEVIWGSLAALAEDQLIPAMQAASQAVFRRRLNFVMPAF